MADGFGVGAWVWVIDLLLVMTCVIRKPALTIKDMKRPEHQLVPKMFVFCLLSLWFFFCFWHVCFFLFLFWFLFFSSRSIDSP